MKYPYRPLKTHQSPYQAPAVNRSDSARPGAEGAYAYEPSFLGLSSAVDWIGRKVLPKAGKVICDAID